MELEGQMQRNLLKTLSEPQFQCISDVYGNKQVRQGTWYLLYKVLHIIGDRKKTCKFNVKVPMLGCWVPGEQPHRTEHRVSVGRVDQG